ncbi:DNA-3-methyladenine glycosylase I [Nonlabens ponticola]|uniref:DNA-3-methyladenine glycosylase I n=1 Tax=Nonlabens ponticola TaxID=2496866 RepID=A0A3S9MUX2_9FLAO|nr:DNA-3-methyladenine glycosylase I [Nonlabens ponticola]AZQ42979.1 DNA-3-methyladenine glycosylase I [Nonlabens ponticola]
MKTTHPSKCAWCLGDPLYEQYHDQEWGVPIHEDRALFEFLILETMQAGLSWITILKKRNNYHDALDQFDYHKIARYNDDKKVELLNNAGIIRNKLKVNSIINNAQVFIEVQKEYGSFSKFLWKYVNGKPIKNNWNDLSEVPATSSISNQLAKDLKKLGFKFIGSTTVYAFMQAVGMVNDHVVTCYRYDEL